MRIALDTNILARANPHSKGVARILLLTILESADHVLVLSPFLLRETERVLNYPRGAVIGRYHLLQKIGEGGMGEVWLAEQKEPVRRRVAIKLIKAGMDTREVVARFESERQLWH